MKPTPFQQRTADYAFARLWDPTRPAYRFLVADEVGLGKTIVARDVVRQTLARFPRSRVDILYVCSNQRIASQNLSKLVVGGAGGAAKATRLSLMALGDASANAGSTRVRYHAITPDTSFNLGSGAGAVRERALIFWALRRPLGIRNLSLLLRERAGERTWEAQQTTVGQAKPDASIVNAFVHAVLADEPLIAILRDLARRAGQGTQDKVFRKARSGAIGRLREKLAAAGVRAVSSTSLIIVDEFQKFPDLLRHPAGNPTLAQQLAAMLFRTDEGNRRVLLLSATPYRLPGVNAGPEERPYDSFVDLIRFMAGNSEADSLAKALGEFSTALQVSEPDGDRVDKARLAAQSILRTVMTRTERVSWTRESDSMVQEQVRPLHVQPEDLRGGVAARKIARLIKAQDAVEYWKSAPYFLDFMRDYQFRKLAMATQGKARRTLAGLARGHLLLEQADLRRLKAIHLPNARLRHLINDALPHGAELLMWVPPSMPYLEPGGAYTGQGPDLKRLVFSEWKLAPDAISAMTSYEAERRLADRQPAGGRKGRRGATKDRGRAHADFAKRGELLRLTRSGTRAGSGADHPQAALAFLIPSGVLAELGDPLAMAVQSGGPVLAREAVKKVSAAIRRGLSALPAGPDKGRPDERWYWAAPLLLDQAAASSWLRLRDPLALALEKGAEVDLAPAMRSVLANPAQLGPRPKKLDQALAALALAGPAVCALRALTRTVSPEASPEAVRRGAFHVARGMQSLFNQPDATLAVQSCHPREKAYWRQALAYCVDGNLQAVFDEQLHLVGEALSLFDSKPDERIEKASRSIHDALTLRRAVVEVSGLERRRGRGSDVETVPLRCRHALRFAEIKEPDGGGVSRLDVVRAAFNSPFRPFVLASTTLGQEGLDFHPWCHAVVHWNLPRSPVELEQREGRVHRYKGQAVRLNVAAAVGLEGLARAGHGPAADPWCEMFEQAAALDPTNELAPAWLFEHGPSPRRVQRIVPYLEFSREADVWRRLQSRLGIYRLVMGLPRQEELLSALEGHVAVEQARAWTIDLRPPVKAAASRGRSRAPKT